MCTCTCIYIIYIDIYNYDNSKLEMNEPLMYETKMIKLGRKQ